MPLIKGDAVEHDIWTYLGSDEYPGGDQPLIVDYIRWREGDEAIAAHNGPLGIRLRSDQAPKLIADDIGRFDLIALAFPVMADGRSFSHARILRNQLHFKGELRAVGTVLEDQMFFMRRCGFDTFELDAEQNVDRAISALTRFSIAYQAASDDLVPAFRSRQLGG